MSYLRFAAMIATSTLVMFVLMYLNTYARSSASVIGGYASAILLVKSVLDGSALRNGTSIHRNTVKYNPRTARITN